MIENKLGKSLSNGAVKNFKMNHLKASIEGKLLLNFKHI